ncbi:MAG: nicotinate-nucleotide adenylyltransferase [Gemmatimonadota bacterium]
MGSRLGVLGGTFDPIHVGHRIVAQDVLEADRLLVVPAARPPHREARLPAERRLRITRRAFEGDRRVEVSRMELDRAGPSYTVDTLEEIRERRSPAALFCVIGADQLRAFDEWRRPERIVELAELVVMNRGDREPEPPEEMPDLAFRAVDVTRVELSSTRIRERLYADRQVRYLVPESVRPEIEAAYGGRPLRA